MQVEPELVHDSFRFYSAYYYPNKYPAIHIHPATIINERAVTEMPVFACSLKPLITPCSRACSKVIRLAILPMVKRLPAKVLVRARTYPWLYAPGWRKFVNSIVAGTLLTILLKKADTPVRT